MGQAAKYSMVVVFALTGLRAALCLAGEGATRPADDTNEIYRAFLSQWKGKNDAPTNVAKTVTLPTREDIAQYNECAGDGGGRRAHWTTSTTDADLRNALASLPGVHMVDPKHWQAADPGRLIAQGQSVDTAVDTGIANGLMTLSAVSFDEARSAAMFNYSFVCGGLCGNGGTVMFQKTTTGWVRSQKRCSSWRS